MKDFVPKSHRRVRGSSPWYESFWWALKNASKGDEANSYQEAAQREHFQEEAKEPANIALLRHHTRKEMPQLLIESICVSSSALKCLRRAHHRTRPTCSG